MAKKRSARLQRPAPKAQAVPRYRQLLLLATAVPMLAGLFLFVASWFDLQIIGTPESQTITGALLALGGFAAANAVQGLWRLMTGWLLIALAIWLVVSAQLPWMVWVGGAVGVLGLGLLLAAFIARYRQVRQSQR